MGKLPPAPRRAPRDFQAVEGESAWYATRPCLAVRPLDYRQISSGSSKLQEAGHDF